MEAPLSPADKPRIDSLLVADHAEAVNGKLYLMGGGFDTLWAPQFPNVMRFSFAAVFKIPWNDTNRRLPVRAWLAHADTQEDLGWKMEGQLEAGRAAGARGNDAQIMVAGPVMFEAPEPLECLLNVDFAGDQRSIPLRVSPPPFGAPGTVPPAVPPE